MMRGLFKAVRAGGAALCLSLGGAAPAAETAGHPPEPEPLLATRLFMPAHVMVRGSCGSEEGYFALDTGAPKNSPMPAIRKHLQPGAAEKGVYRGKIRIGDQDFPLDFGSGETLTPVVEKGYPGVPVLAVLGDPFLRRFTVRFDFLSQTFSLYEPGSLPLPKADMLGPDHLLADFTSTPQGHILVDIAMGEGDLLTGKAVLDVGTPRFEFPSGLGARHGFPADRIPTMRVGGMRWTDVPTNADREKLFETPFFGKHRIIGFLSVEQVRNAVVTVHYRERKLEILRDPTRAPGVSLKEFGLKLSPEGRVAEVKEGSRAEACGFQKGDLLREVDGRKVADQIEILSVLKFRGAETPLSFRVSRNGSDGILAEDPKEEKR